MFPVYDLSIQVRCLEQLATAGLPVPAIVAWEPDPSILGRPFYVMDRIAGYVPPDSDPPFTRAGRLFDASPERQEAFYRGAVAVIVAVNRVPPPADLPVGPTVSSHLESCRSLVDWSTVRHSDVDSAYDELLRSTPEHASDHTCLLWGDARPANMILDDDFAISGLLDWELAATGPAELDLAWFLEMNRMRAGASPALPGFLSDTATWDLWSQLSGRAPVAPLWHQRFAAYRVAVFFFLNLRAAVTRGQLAAGHRVFTDNIATRRLRALFEAAG